MPDASASASACRCPMHPPPLGGKLAAGASAVPAARRPASVCLPSSSPWHGSASAWGPSRRHASRTASCRCARVCFFGGGGEGAPHAAADGVRGCKVQVQRAASCVCVRRASCAPAQAPSCTRDRHTQPNPAQGMAHTLAGCVLAAGAGAAAQVAARGGGGGHGAARTALHRRRGRPARLLPLRRHQPNGQHAGGGAPRSPGPGGGVRGGGVLLPL